jgi:sugar lactone lactonase YvrE
MAISVVNGISASLVLGAPNLASSGNFGSPRSVTMDPTTGKLFVTDTFNRQVLRYASANSLVNDSAAEASFGGVYAFGVSVDSAGRLWVGDGNNRVVRFDNASSRGSTATPDGVLGQPNFSSTGAATSQNGLRDPEMVFADSGNSRVLMFGTPTNTIATYGASMVLETV